MSNVNLLGLPVMQTLNFINSCFKARLDTAMLKDDSCLYNDSDKTHGLKTKKAFLNEVVYVINSLHVGRTLYQGLAASSSKDIACCLIYLGK